MEFLTIGEEAPFRVDRKEFEAGKLPDFNGADFALAECLAHGKDAAVTYFRPVVQVSKVVL